MHIADKGAGNAKASLSRADIIYQAVSFTIAKRFIVGFIRYMVTIVRPLIFINTTKIKS
jgi:hypothetical protein